jgi:CheY-like chemotaxis protein
MAPSDILVVDDNPKNLMLLSRILQEAGHAVRVANRGPRALDLMRLEPPDLVLLDIQMPECDGYEVCSLMKAEDALREIPVIFVSALDEAFDKVRAFEAGGADYVAKPFHELEVLARVENQLRVSRLRRQLEEQNRELKKTNQWLLEAIERTEAVFTALSKTLPGNVLDDRYRIEAQIGSGGYGAVYRATHLVLDRPVAVKIFRPMSGNASTESLRRFRLEGVAACRVNHPNAVAVFDCSVSPDGMAYLVMELLDGPTLAEELGRHGALAPHRAVEIAIPVCDVLARIHDEGMVHRDIKPENVLLHHGPEGEVVKVLDFGVVKLLDPQAPFTIQVTADGGGLVGTPSYIAPEVLLEEAFDGRADVFSLGTMLYRMLAGRLPFEPASGSIAALVLQCLRSRADDLREVNPDVPEALAAAVMRAIAKSPRERPAARELARELAASLEA